MTEQTAPNWEQRSDARSEFINEFHNVILAAIKEPEVSVQETIKQQLMVVTSGLLLIARFIDYLDETIHELGRPVVDIEEFQKVWSRVTEG